MYQTQILLRALNEVAAGDNRFWFMLLGVHAAIQKKYCGMQAIRAKPIAER